MVKKINIFLMLSLFAANAFAIPFTITPSGSLPTSVPSGGTVSATYTVKNNTLVQRSNNYVKYLPPNVSIAAGGCGSTFNLGPGASCELNLTISGPVDASDPNPQHHLFVCFPGGTSCAGTLFPLNVTASSTPQTVGNAYITVGNDIYFCQAATDGSLGNCMITPSSGVSFNTLLDIAITTVNGTKYAYVLDVGTNPSVFQCAINSDGTFNSCTPVLSFMAATNTTSLAITTVNGTQYLYITLQNTSIPYYQILADGSLQPQGTTSTIGNGFEITFATVGGIQYAYITDPGTGSLINCPVNLDGSFAACSIAGTATNFGNTSPIGVDFATLNGTQYAFLATFAPSPSGLFGYVYSCTLNNLNGAVNTCTQVQTSSPNADQYGRITLSAINNSYYSYVSTTSQSTLINCPVNTDSSFGTCINTPSPTPWPQTLPTSITFG